MNTCAKNSNYLANMFFFAVRPGRSRKVRPGVLKTCFPRTRSTDASLRENPDEKYFFIMENDFPKKFETQKI